MEKFAEVCQYFGPICSLQSWALSIALTYVHIFSLEMRISDSQLQVP